MSPRLIFIIEHCTSRVWIFFTLPRLVLERFSGRSLASVTCLVIDRTPLGLALARLSSALLGFPLEIFRFRLMDVKDQEGLLVRLRVAFMEAVKINNAIRKDPLYLLFEKAGAFKDRAGTFVYKVLCDVLIIQRGTLGRTLFLVHLANWKKRQMELPRESRPALFLQKAPWSHILQRYSTDFGVDLVPVPAAFHLFDFLRDEMKPVMPDGFNTVVNFLRFRRSDLKRPDYRRQLLQWVFRKDPNVPPAAPRIAGEFHGHLNLDRPEVNSDFFYWQESDMPGSDCAALFGTSVMPLDQKKVAEMERHGISPIVVRPEATTDFSVPIYDIGRKLRSENRPAFPRTDGSLEAKKLKDILTRYHKLRQNWSRVFRSENLKVYLSWYRYSSDHCAIADAMQENGGVTALYQRAYDALPAPDLAIAADVVFGFSPHSINVETGSHSDISYFVATGYLADHRFALLKEQAEAWRRSLLEKGAKKIISFFDENSGADSRWHTGHDLQRMGYQALAEKVLSEPWLGLIIKPKVPKNLRGRLGPVAETLKAAEATGRCIVLEEGERLGARPPAEAALASDLAIHNCLASGTAGMEAALAGVPTLLMDIEGWHVSPLSQLGEGRVVFKDWASVWDACKDHFFREGGIPGFGDWSPQLDQMDPFRDGQAAKRMGKYLEWLLEGFKVGKDRKAVMADAADRYAQAWGADKIFEVRNEQAIPTLRKSR